MSQRGQLFKRSGSWYVRYYEGGRRVAVRLGRINDFPTRRMIEPLAQDHMRLVSGSTSAVTLEGFIEGQYLPWAKAQLRPSTSHGYQKIYDAHLKGLKEAQLKTRDYRVVDAQALLNAIAAKRPLAPQTLQHVKHFLSGAFKYAAQCGVREFNPMPECRLPKTTKAARTTYAYNLGEVNRMLLVLPLELKAAVATAAFAGLRLSELQGLEWPDYDGANISVRRSMWRGFESDPKTPKSKDYVPAIAPLRAILDEYRGSRGSGGSSAKVWPFDLTEAGRWRIRRLIATTGLLWKGWHV